MQELTTMRCIGCEGGVPVLTHAEIKTFLGKIQGWSVDSSEKKISKRFTFKNFYHVMNFVNAIAWIANQENHHPDLTLGFNYCEVNFMTHAINGLSKNDFICAAKVDALRAVV